MYDNQLFTKMYTYTIWYVIVLNLVTVIIKTTVFKAILNFFSLWKPLDLKHILTFPNQNLKLQMSMNLE